jgi:hypothetical protein
LYVYARLTCATPFSYAYPSDKFQNGLIMVVRVEVLDSEPEGCKLVTKTYGQWNILKGNFNMRSLKLYWVATEDDPCLEVVR